MENEALKGSAHGKGYIMLFNHTHKIIKVYRNGYIFQRCVVPCCTVCFKGGSPKPPTSTIADTPTRQYARETLYPQVTEGLEGRGFGTPQLTALRSSSLYRGLEETFKTAKGEFESQTARTLDPRDVRLKSYLSNTLQREYVTKKDEIARGIRAEKVSDIDLSQAMAGEFLASERRMAIGGAEMYNQALQQNIINQQRIGTFGSNLASGIGAGAMDFYFAQRMGGVS